MKGSAGYVVLREGRGPLHVGKVVFFGVQNWREILTCFFFVISCLSGMSLEK